MPLKAVAKNAALFARLFSYVYLEAPDVAMLKVLRDTSVRELWPFPGDDQTTKAFKDIKTCLHDISENHAARLTEDHLLLFLGIGMPLAPLWGSVYLDEENLLQQESTIAFKKFLHRCHLSYVRSEKQPLDHLGICLAALAILTERCLDPDQVVIEQAAKDVRSLLSEHLMPWADRCLELTWEHSKTPFYLAMAKLTHKFLHHMQTLSDAPKPARKLFY